MNNPTHTASDFVKRAQSLPGAIGADLAGLGGFLRCETCGYRSALDDRDIAAYLSLGWPKCCGYTMRWWTQRQIDANEVPELAAGAGE